MKSLVSTCAKSKFYGAIVLNRRVVLHAIDATPARWRGDAGSSPLDGASTAASSSRNDLVKNCRVHPTHWLISTQVDGEGTNTVPRDDVAETMVQSLRHEAFRDRSFDLRSKLEGDGDPTSDFSRLLAPLGGRNCDYSLGKIPDG